MKTEAFKVEPFENAPSLLFIGENGGFWKRYRKKGHFLSFPSAFSGVLVWTIGQNVSKSMRFRMKTNECGQEKKKRNASVVDNILLRLSWDENKKL